MSTLAKVRESCRCGAVLEYEGKYPRAAADSFRLDHRICRESVWQVAPPRDSGKRSDGSLVSNTGTSQDGE